MRTSEAITCMRESWQWTLLRVLANCLLRYSNDNVFFPRFRLSVQNMFRLPFRKTVNVRNDTWLLKNSITLSQLKIMICRLAFLCVYEQVINV